MLLLRKRTPCGMGKTPPPESPFDEKVGISCSRGSRHTWRSVVHFFSNLAAPLRRGEASCLSLTTAKCLFVAQWQHFHSSQWLGLFSYCARFNFSLRMPWSYDRTICSSQPLPTTLCLRIGHTSDASSMLDSLHPLDEHGC